MWAFSVVQEAIAHHSLQELEDIFDSACALLYEAFPKKVNGDYLSDEWSKCQTYITHGAHLASQFSILQRAGRPGTYTLRG
jgi:hypothetical protein